jgi:hypothetical protein
MNDKELIQAQEELAVPETVDQDIVPVMVNDNHILDVAKRIDELVSAHNKIRTAILKLALPGDWVVFDSGDGKDQKCGLGAAGALRIAATVGIGFQNWEARKESGTDEHGEWYRWDFECDSVFRGTVIRVYGRAGTRDKFFGKSHGQYKQLSDISEGDIKMAARRSAMKEGVKVQLGLHNIPASTLKSLGVPVHELRGHTFDQTKTISEAQRKLLYAKTKEYGWDETRVKEMIKNRFKKEHSSELTTSELNTILEVLKGGESK